MDNLENIPKFIIYTEAYLVEPGCWEFVHKDRKSYRFPEFDFYVPIFLTRTNEIYEYVQVNRDERIQKIERQEVNPFFIELSFFDGIQRAKALRGSDLTINAINFIRDARPELAGTTNQEVIFWFDQIGVNELPWFRNTNNQITADDLDIIDVIPSHIISKANYFNIDINK